MKAKRLDHQALARNLGSTVRGGIAAQEATNPKFLEIMERSRAAHREQGGISPDEMRDLLGIKHQKVRNAPRSPR